MFDGQYSKKDEDRDFFACGWMSNKRIVFIIIVYALFATGLGAFFLNLSRLLPGRQKQIDGLEEQIDRLENQVRRIQD
jgi:hypothetical protein